MADVTKITSGSLIAAEQVNGTSVYNMDGDKLGTVDDIVGPILFLASERARFVTGQVLYVDGGRTLV